MAFDDFSESLAGAVGGFAQGAGEQQQLRQKYQQQLLLEDFKQKKQTNRMNKNIELFRKAGYNVEPTLTSSGKIGVKVTEPKTEAEKKSKLSRTAQFEQDIKSAITGEKEWDDLGFEYPLKGKKISEIKAKHTPVSQTKGFVRGTGGLVSRLGSLGSKTQAEISDRTQQAIDLIKTEADLTEFISDEEMLDPKIDFDAVLEYFGRPRY